MARTKRTVAFVFGALFLVVLAFVLRATAFAPRFAVTSIATAAEYNDPALLERAWALPVARSYDHRVVSQSNGSVCGPATLANVFRSLGEARVSEGEVLAGTGKCRIGYCLPGVTLDELAEIARTRLNGTTRHVTVLRDLGRDEFKEHLRKSNDPSRRYTINFQRGLLFGKGTGHHSPLVGYLEDRDLALVLDVNGKFGPWLVPADRLFTAIDSVDSSTGKKRGLLLID